MTNSTDPRSSYQIPYEFYLTFPKDSKEYQITQLTIGGLKDLINVLDHDHRLYDVAVISLAWKEYERDAEHNRNTNTVRSSRSNTNNQIFTADFTEEEAGIRVPASAHRIGKNPELINPADQYPIEGKIYKLLFEDKKHVTIADNIYQWDEDQYKQIDEGELRSQIWLKLASDFPKQWRESTVNNCLKALKGMSYKSADKLNSNGFNLANGTLQVSVVDGKVKVDLLPHDPTNIFNYCSPVKYNPEADRSAAKQMLECIDEPYRTIWLRTIACAFALPEVRKRWNRIKGLIMTGTGSNGKDTVMESIRMLFQSSMTRVDAVAMKQYDEGRKFGIYSLLGSQINYCSEARNINSLSDCSVFKNIISGDVINLERKGKDEHPYVPQCVLVFSTNERWEIKDNSEAVRSRLCEIPFKKTYSVHPKAGQLKADPRFKNDPTFIAQNILPGLLNMLIEELQNVLDHGIDYTVTDQDMDQIKYENDRIYRYFTDRGIVVSDASVKDQYITLKDAYGVYKTGLINDGVEEDQITRSKHYCGEEQQFTSWIKKSFPHIETGQRRVSGAGKVRVIYGLHQVLGHQPSHQDNLDTARVWSQDTTQDSSKTTQDTTKTPDSPCLGSVSEMSQHLSRLKAALNKDVLVTWEDSQNTGYLIAINDQAMTADVWLRENNQQIEVSLHLISFIDQ